MFLLLMCIFSSFVLLAQTNSMTKNTVYVLKDAIAVLKCNVPPKSRSAWAKASSGIDKQHDISYHIPYSDGREINTRLPNMNNLAIVGKISEGNYNLQIKNVSSDDEGMYICSHRSNESGVNESYVVLKLKVQPKDINILQVMNGIVEGDEGTQLNLTCTVSSGIPPEEKITWYNMSAPINTGGPGMLSVLVTPTRNDHMKKYSCNVTSETLHQPLQKNITLDIRYKPKVTINYQNLITVTEYKNMTFACSSQGNPVVKYMRIESGRQTVLKRCYKSACSVTFLNIKREEAGLYKCIARNDIGTDEKPININVQYPPSVNITQDQHGTTLHCNPIGNPSNYTFHLWEHHSNFGQMIRMSDKGQNWTIVNREKQYQMNGIYICKVDNGVKDINGSTIQSARISVKRSDKPIFVSQNSKTQFGRFGFPVLIKVYVYSFPEITDVNINVTKKGVNKNNNITMENSTLTDIIFNKTVEIFGYIIILHRYNLTKDDFTSYEFHVTNEIGESVFLVNLTAADLPEKPKIIKLVPDIETLEVYWTSTFNGGKEQQFILEYKTVEDRRWNKVPPINDSSVACCRHVLYHLRANENYMIRLYAQNELGRSNCTKISMIRTLSYRRDILILTSHVGGIIVGIIFVVSVFTISILLRRKIGFFCKRTYQRQSSGQTEVLQDEMAVENFLYLSQEGTLASRRQQNESENQRNTNQHQTTALLQTGYEASYQNNFTANSSHNEANFSFAVENSIYQSQTSNAIDKIHSCDRSCVGKCRFSSQERRLPDRITNINDKSGQFSERSVNIRLVQDNGALHYVEVVFDPLNSTNEAHIHGINNRTIYADINTGVVGTPLEESEEDDNEDDDDFMYIDGIIDYTKKS